MLHKDLTNQIIRAFYNVYNELGYGFLEKVYENALNHELGEQGIKAFRQQKIEVFYKEELVGDYYADLIVEDTVIVEVKAMEAIAEEHEFQLINYLKATEKEIGLLLNFGKKPQFKRKIFTNE
jgi:GxxExxY protein